MKQRQAQSIHVDLQKHSTREHTVSSASEDIDRKYLSFNSAAVTCEPYTTIHTDDGKSVSSRAIDVDSGLKTTAMRRIVCGQIVYTAEDLVWPQKWSREK